MAKKYITTQIAILLLLSHAHAADNDADAEWRTFINDACIITDEPFLVPVTGDQSTARVASLLGVIATRLTSALVNSVVTGITGGIRAGGASKDTTFVTTNDFNLYRADLSESPAAQINPRLGCITVVAGHFQSGSQDCSADYIPRTVSAESLDRPHAEWQTDRTDSSVENILKRANVCLDGPTKSVFEARLEFSEDKTAYRMNNAGYWINSLNSTKSTRAKRSLLYTLEIIEPSEGSGDRVLSTAWVNVGEVSAGVAAIGTGTEDRSDWLRVPAISRAARQVHGADTSLHADVLGEIEALERAVLRDARLLAGIEKRAENASSAVRRALEKEIARLSVSVVTKEAMLEARKAEYEDLPQSTLLYMPVTMRFGVTETRSQRRTMQVLTAMLDINKEVLTDAATDMVRIDRSLDLGSAQADIGSLRNNYFDALVAVNTSSPESDEAREELERQLALAKNAYNAARDAEGLTPID